MKSILIFLLLIILHSTNAQRVVWDSGAAFPSLKGEGADRISGGSNGALFFITTLSNLEEATFYAATDSTEAHYKGSISGAFLLRGQGLDIIPRVSGSVSGMDINITFADQGNKTYHGHLAPEGGLAHINGKIQIANTSNIIIRYLTTRNGNTATLEIDDQVSISRSERIVLDHVSLGWSGDELLNIFPGTVVDVIYSDIILQHILFGQARFGHNTGAILGASTSGTIRGETIYNIHKSFFAAVQSRTPNVAGRFGSLGRVHNNVVYNWVGRTINLFEGARIDNFGCWYRTGPRSITLANSMINQVQNENGDLNRIFSAGNHVEGLLEDPDVDNKTIWTYFDDTNTTQVADNLFRSTPVPISDVGYRYVSASEAYDKIITQRNVGNNRSTSALGVPIIAHDAIDAHYFDSFISRTDSWQDEVDWIHPVRASNSFYTDDNWNGIYDLFEAENNIVVSTQVKEQYTWQGVTYVNKAGYNARDAWSIIMAGQIKPTAPNTNASVKKSKI
ncbi:hypothetical protein [Spongiimicrobium salis]|uniref:hypothetical protein n=1 Tax=Spongiimicrobium salis TaxID=1667022 RepID=UPI00374DE192